MKNKKSHEVYSLQHWGKTQGLVRSDWRCCKDKATMFNRIVMQTAEKAKQIAISPLAKV